jgi:prolyl oligopeptidase PreP (S9A serine peptidase family)
MSTRQTATSWPRGRLCVAPLTAPTEWRTLIPESSDTLQTVAGVGGRLYAVYSHAASHRMRIHAEDGTYLRKLVLPALGSVNRNEGEGVISGVSGTWSGDEVWVSFQSYVQPPSIYRYDYAADRLSPYHVPNVGLDGTRVSMFIIHRKDLPDDPIEGAYLAGYSPYHNVRADRRYPVMMFVSSLNDRLAPPHDPLKVDKPSTGFLCPSESILGRRCLSKGQGRQKRGTFWNGGTLLSAIQCLLETAFHWLESYDHYGQAITK